MLKKCGLDISSRLNKKLANVIKFNGTSYLKNCDVKVPGDPSSAAFIIVACSNYQRQ